MLITIVVMVELTSSPLCSSSVFQLMVFADIISWSLCFMQAAVAWMFETVITIERMQVLKCVWAMAIVQFL